MEFFFKTTSNLNLPLHIFVVIFVLSRFFKRDFIYIIKKSIWILEKVMFINEFGKKTHSNNQRYFPNPSIKEDLAPLDTITNHRKKDDRFIVPEIYKRYFNSFRHSQVCLPILQVKDTYLKTIVFSLIDSVFYNYNFYPSIFHCVSYNLRFTRGKP